VLFGQAAVGNDPGRYAVCSRNQGLRICSRFAILKPVEAYPGEGIMEVFKALFTGFEGWLVLGIIVFMLVMMAYLVTMFVSKSGK
jgi:hypothetical protein